MGDVHADIKPGGLNQKELINLLGMLTYSLEGVCTKLDLDGGVPSTTYLANCYTDIVNTVINDCVGNRRGQYIAEHLFYEMSPGGITDASLLEWIYNYFNAIETLTEQLDGDSLSDTDFEALVYTAYFTWQVENQNGNALGNGTDVVYLKPGGVLMNEKMITFLYNAVKAWDVLLAKLDSDGTVTDTTYKALWYTATVLLKVEDSMGNLTGNTRTDI